MLNDEKTETRLDQKYPLNVSKEEGASYTPDDSYLLLFHFVSVKFPNFEIGIWNWFSVQDYYYPWLVWIQIIQLFGWNHGRETVKPPVLLFIVQPTVNGIISTLTRVRACIVSKS